MCLYEGGGGRAFQESLPWDYFFLIMRVVFPCNWTFPFVCSSYVILSVIALIFSTRKCIVVIWEIVVLTEDWVYKSRLQSTQLVIEWDSTECKLRCFIANVPRPPSIFIYRKFGFLSNITWYLLHCVYLNVLCFANYSIFTLVVLV